MISNWLSLLKSLWKPRCRPKTYRPTFRPQVEGVEERIVPAGDIVLRWNAIALQAVATDHSGGKPEQGGPTDAARALAMVHVAIFDAVNSIADKFQPYLVDLNTPDNTSVEAAVSKAARDTLVALYPRQKTLFHQTFRQTIKKIPNQEALNNGIVVGKRVAKAILADRKNDGAELPMPYTPGNQPGDHQPDPLHPNQGFLGPGYGQVKPFAISKAEDFMPAPPPDLNSAEYTAAYNELLRLGGDGVNTPTERTAEQSTIGVFWGYDGTPKLGPPPRLYNQIARVLSKKMDNTTLQNARMFALINLAQADAGIACWLGKYEYNLWRPVVGIRQGDADGNAATVGDPNWRPLGAPASNGAGTDFTPPFPAYTSGHATFGASLFRMLERFYRTDKMRFSLTSDECNGVTTDQNGQVRAVEKRSFRSFSQAAEENGQSRIYLGIHWAFDKTRGIKQGNAIADHVFANFLKPRGS